MSDIEDFEGGLKLRHAGHVIGSHHTEVTNDTDLLLTGRISRVA